MITRPVVALFLESQEFNKFFKGCGTKSRIFLSPAALPAGAPSPAGGGGGMSVALPDDDGGAAGGGFAANYLVEPSSAQL